MPRLPLRDLVIKKPRPLLTLHLMGAYLDHPAETVATYVFTDSIRHHFELIFDSAARGAGQGYWVQAEYGAGKTHFLATLAALLSNTSGDLWARADDADIRQHQRRLQNTRLFPVVLSLRGQASAGEAAASSLMDVLLEQGFRPALERAGLAGRVELTSAEALVAWYQNQAGDAIKADFEAHVKRAAGMSPAQLLASEGPEALAGHLTRYLADNGVRPEIAAGVKDRLAAIYRQLTEGEPGYTGLLVVIDEYEGWANIRGENREARARDEDLLETLGYLLPKELGMAAHVIVASQSAVPAKLQGGQEGDRYINLPLLADRDAHDYDIIASRRVRQLNPERAPEIADHYRYYAETFDFARQLSEAQFRETFPFQPRCFEIVRRITARDLPGPRSGILILHEVINEEPLLARDMLIRASDLVGSRHLVEDCLSKAVYKPHLRAYHLALEALPSLELDEGDRELAAAILATLYLWYEAHLERPRPLSVKELAEATLTTADVVRAEDSVAYVLSQMQSLQQVQFEQPDAQFVPAGEDGPSPITLFKEFARRAEGDRHAVEAAWSESLFLTSQQTLSTPGLFSEFQPGAPGARQFDVRNLQYQGEVVIASRWQEEWGQKLTADDAHFRVVVMTPDAAGAVKPADLQDPRVAVVYPASLSDEALKAAAEYLAWKRMSEEYKGQTGKEAEAIREWLATQRGACLGNLLQTQVGLYRNGQIVTRDDVGIGAKEAFQLASNDRRISFIVEKLLVAAYPQLPVEFADLRSTLTPTEAGKVFGGYFDKEPSNAQTTATRNYGVALGLSHLDQPARFAPQDHCRALALIAEMLAERKGGEVPVWKVFETLSRPPYGLPYVVIQLYLLAFVRRANPRVELMLKSGHKLKARDGKAYPRDRIGASNVADLQWRPGLHAAFDTLIPTAGPHWNDVLGFARELVHDLRATTNQAEIEAEHQRLVEALASLGEAVPKQREELAVLERALGENLPGEAQQSIKHLEDLAQQRDGYEAFFEAAQELFRTPDGLRDTMKSYNRLRDLAAVTAQVAEVKRYLEVLRLRPGDRELEAQKNSLLAQINMVTLEGQPHLWGGMRSTFEQFKARYRNEYQKHHRDANAALRKTAEALADAPRRLRALALVNSIQEIGPEQGAHLAGEYAGLQSRLTPCPIVNFQDVSVDAAPACAACGRDLTYQPPEAEAQAFLKALDAALAEKQRSLASEAIRRVLERAQGDALAQFVQAAQAANVAALVDLLDENTVKIVRQLLAEEQIGAAEGDVIGKFKQKYGSLEEADIPEAVKLFEALLREAFQEAKKANKGKKTIRLTVK